MGNLCIAPKIGTVQLAVVSLSSFALLYYIGWYVLLFGVLRMMFRGELTDRYIKSIGVAVDDIGGTILFGTIRHTISANIGLREYKGYKSFERIAKVVDYKYFFGEKHCYCLAVREGLIKEKDKDV